MVTIQLPLGEGVTPYSLWTVGEDLVFVIQIKLNQLFHKMSTSSLTYQEFYPEDGGENQLA